MRQVLALAAVMAAALVSTAPAFGTAERLKPKPRDFDRVQSANFHAHGTLGLADQRGCDRDDFRCLDRATSAEAAAYGRAAALERTVAQTLARGTCRAAMLERAARNSRHAANVRKAKAAWHARDYQAAARFYHARPVGGRLDGLVFDRC